MAIAAALVLSSGVAIAETINGTEGPDTLNGTDGNDYLYGKGGGDTIDGMGGSDWVYGGPGNDTLKDRGGNDQGWYGDVFAGEDGDDFIDATTKNAYDGHASAYRDYIYCNEGFDRVWYDAFDTAHGYTSQGTGAYCESMLDINTRSGSQIYGSFFREGSTVNFNGYTESGGDVPGGSPYDKKSTSTIYVNNKPFTLTVDPKAKTVKQTVAAEDGYYNVLTEADIKAVQRTRTELGEFLGSPGGSTLKNQEHLVLRHLDRLAEKPAGYKFKNETTAYDPKEPSAEEAGRLGPPDDPNASGRGRINLATGNAYEQKEDLFVPGGRGMPLRFARTYNSRDNYNGPLGYGWTHNFNASLKEEQDGSVTHSGPQGARKKFARKSDGSYTPPRGVHDTLTKASDGTFSLRKKNGVEWSFDTGGKLKKIQDPNGNAINLTYDANQRLSKITDTVGRETSLSYDSSGRITTLADSANRTVSGLPPVKRTL